MAGALRLDFDSWDSCVIVHSHWLSLSAVHRGYRGTKSLHVGNVWLRLPVAHMMGTKFVRLPLTPQNGHLVAQWPRGARPELQEHQRLPMQLCGELKPEEAGGSLFAWLRCEAPSPLPTPKARDCKSYSSPVCSLVNVLLMCFFANCPVCILKQKIWPRFGVRVHGFEEAQTSFQGLWQPHQQGRQVKSITATHFQLRVLLTWFKVIVPPSTKSLERPLVPHSSPRTHS